MLDILFMCYSIKFLIRVVALCVSMKEALDTFTIPFQSLVQAVCLYGRRTVLFGTNKLLGNETDL